MLYRKIKKKGCKPSGASQSICGNFIKKGLLKRLVRKIFGIVVPKKVSFVKIIEIEECMKIAKLKISWGKSPSLDVIQYNVIVINEDTQQVILDKMISFAETQVVLEVAEKTNITVTVFANDGFFDSDPVSTSYSVGDLTAPLPVGFVGIEVVGVREESVEEALETEVSEETSEPTEE